MTAPIKHPKWTSAISEGVDSNTQPAPGATSWHATFLTLLQNLAAAANRNLTPKRQVSVGSPAAGLSVPTATLKVATTTADVATGSQGFFLGLPFRDTGSAGTVDSRAAVSVNMSTYDVGIYHAIGVPTTFHAELQFLLISPAYSLGFAAPSYSI